MNTNYQTYYCHLKKGTPVIHDHKPENFEAFPSRYIVHCPNSKIAELTFKSNLRIEKWRS